MRRRTSEHLDTHLLSKPYISSSPAFYAPTRSVLPPPPPNSNEKPAHTNTFVHKLYNMVIDSYYQHLISWSYSGSSFIVCNLIEFSKDVLPKHFKHNNFSSFVRQLNMYGFHKVNKSPRGHRTLAENQIWEFSHKQFLRNRPDLLDDIKRKTLESENTKREGGDMNSQMTLMQASQTELIQQMQSLYQNFSQAMKEMQEMKHIQEQQANMLKTMANYISQQNGGHLPYDLNLAQFELDDKNQTPSIFVTTHEPNSSQLANSILQDILHRSPLSVHTQNIPFGHSKPLPPSPSPSMLISDDEFDTSLYSPNSPHTPRQPNSHQSYSYSLSHR